MEKFAIDLDKVLDDFEINEDREERLAAVKLLKPAVYPSSKSSDEHIDTEFHHSKCDESFVSHVNTVIPNVSSHNSRDVKTIVSTSTQSCEDKKPDLLGTLGSQPQKQQQLQKHESSGMEVAEAEGSLPDVTVLSRPATRHVDTIVNSGTSEVCNEDSTMLSSVNNPYQGHNFKTIEFTPTPNLESISSDPPFIKNENFASLDQTENVFSNYFRSSTLQTAHSYVSKFKEQSDESISDTVVVKQVKDIQEKSEKELDSGLVTCGIAYHHGITVVPNADAPKCNETLPEHKGSTPPRSGETTSSYAPLAAPVFMNSTVTAESHPKEIDNIAGFTPNANHEAVKQITTIPEVVSFSSADNTSDSELERLLCALENEELVIQQSQSTMSERDAQYNVSQQGDRKNESSVNNSEERFENIQCLISTKICDEDCSQLSTQDTAHPTNDQMHFSNAFDFNEIPGVSQPKIQEDLQDNQLLHLVVVATTSTALPEGRTDSIQNTVGSLGDMQMSNTCNNPPPDLVSSQEQQISTESQYSTEEDEEGRPHRPRSLQLSTDDDVIPYPPGSTVTVGPPGNTPGSNVPAVSGMSYTIPPEEPITPSDNYEASPSASSSSSSSGAEEATALDDQHTRPTSLLQSLGVVPPYWVPDAEAPICMHCEAKFTVIKRRHHCRACGKVLCSRCCGQKARLHYLENAEARVCQSCYPILCAAQDDDSGSNSNSPQRLGRPPNPNNPMEYCSTIPPLQQAVGSRNQRPPSVMVPVGVLKREGSSRNRGEPKQVMFSDGIRPGGDLTDLDGWAESRLTRKQGRQARRVGTPPGPLLSPATTASTSAVQGLRVPEVPECRPRSVELRNQSNVLGTTGGMVLVPSDLASYTLLADSRPGAFSFELSADTSNLMETLRNEEEPPVVFALNKNLFVLVKIITLSCCVHKTVWCFTTRGLRCEGQDEMVFILEALPDEKCVPRDVFAHISAVYLEAGKGNAVTELGHTTFHGPFLDSNEHGGFLYIRPTSQCLQRLVLPPPPYLVAILLQRWEAPWARLFPLRLLLRLGYEFRYYPCPLVSVRERRPVYCEVGQTILDILADFRNFTYTLPCIQGLVIHMEDRQTSLLIPKNRYDQVVRVLNNSNDHVLALGGSFSRAADSHLVCVQSDDDTYHSKAISILNRPRKVTGASFLVFNGALKTSSGLSAKSSIVEDGLMVQVPSETMQALRSALRDMKNFSVGCGPASVHPPAEIVLVSWVDDDRYFNVGVRSQIDGSKLDGVPSIRVHNGTDYRRENCFIRWTECEEAAVGNARTGTELDISRVSESIARAFCVALVPLLELLATAGLLILAVRATLDPDNVGYEAGSSGEKLPPLYMRSLDDELVPVIHQAASQSGEGKTVLELVFSVMRH